VVDFINSMEILTSYLVLTNSHWVADDIYIEPVVLSVPGVREMPCYEIRTFTTRKLFKTVDIGSPIGRVLYKIFQSEVIT